MKIRQLYWWQLEKDGEIYIRLNARSWAQWQGESLELIQFDIDSLESAFQMEMLRFSSKLRPGWIPKNRNFRKEANL